MPLGFERLNERKQRPNASINFIKPLATSSVSDQAIARDFLERIAAQCYPVMKRDYVSVMSLEEYSPNREFLGRNFNAGEVIQLVLKDKAGRWLSFKFVQMVMMHELAHCKQMNHSRLFWQVRNRYADHMKELWDKKYTGEGLWGRGQDLTNGQFVHDHMPDDADIPEHLCGGTYRRARGRKRKRGQADGEKPTLSYAERQQKRIARKFGVHGEGHDLGEDELVRGAIETMKGGKRGYAKPKVANSKRGRELRANAALARFEAAKTVKTEDSSDLPDDSGGESDWSGDGDDLGGGTLAFDGTKIKDENGHDMFRVCGDEGDQDDGFQNEMTDLQAMGANTAQSRKGVSRSLQPSGAQVIKQEDSETESESGQPEPQYRSNEDYDKPNRRPEKQPTLASETHQTGDDSDTEVEDDLNVPANADGAVQARSASSTATLATVEDTTNSNANPAAQAEPVSASSPHNTATCPICSLENEITSPTCIACAHVLKPGLVPNHWRCKSDTCIGSSYINAGDAGRCGLCGAQRPAATAGGRPTNSASRPMGMVGADVLRWD